MNGWRDEKTGNTEKAAIRDRHPKSEPDGPHLGVWPVPWTTMLAITGQSSGRYQLHFANVKYCSYNGYLHVCHLLFQNIIQLCTVTLANKTWQQAACNFRDIWCRRALASIYEQANVSQLADNFCPQFSYLLGNTVSQCNIHTRDQRTRRREMYTATALSKSSC